MPKFSIIIPTYNRAELLSNAIRSILGQTYGDFELIIVNDGSNDKTEEVVKSFDDQRIVYIRHEINKGVYAGENTGVRASNGEYIIFLGDDDKFYPDALLLVYSKIKEYFSDNVKILWFDSIDIDTEVCASQNDKKERFISYKDLLCDTFKIDPIVVLESNLLKNKMISEGFWGDSGTIWLDFYKNDSKCLPLYVPQIICEARSLHGQHMSHAEIAIGNISKVIMAQQFFLKNYGKELIKHCPQRYGQRQAMTGFYQILNGEKKEGRANIIKSFEFNFSFKYFFYFLFSYILTGHALKYFYKIFSKLKRFIFHSN